MTTLIQLTDTSNIPLNDIILGSVSGQTTFSFRVWNNLGDYPSMSALSGLTINLDVPPTISSHLLANNGAVLIRCVFSGQSSAALDTTESPYETFPYSGDLFSRLDPRCYTEFEVKIDMDVLSTEQLNYIEDILTSLNVTAMWTSEFDPRSIPRYTTMPSVSIISRLDNKLTSLSNTYIYAGREEELESDSRIRASYAVDNISDTRVITPYTLTSFSETQILTEGITSIQLLTNTAMRTLYQTIELPSFAQIKRETMQDIYVHADTQIIRLRYTKIIYSKTNITATIDMPLLSDTYIKSYLQEVVRNSDTSISMSGLKMFGSNTTIV